MILDILPNLIRYINRSSVGSPTDGVATARHAGQDDRVRMARAASNEPLERVEDEVETEGELRPEVVIGLQDVLGRELGEVREVAVG